MNMNFEEFELTLRTAPLLWHPEVFKLAVELCIKKKVFQKGAMAKYCREEEKRRKYKEK